MAKEIIFLNCQGYSLLLFIELENNTVVLLWTYFIEYSEGSETRSNNLLVLLLRYTTEGLSNKIFPHKFPWSKYTWLWWGVYVSTVYVLLPYRCDKDPAQLWTGALGVLMTAKELSQVIITREANLEAEILLNLGINNV